MTQKHVPPKMALPRTPDYYQDHTNTAVHQEFLAAPTALRNEDASTLIRLGSAVAALALGVSLSFLGAPQESEAVQPLPLQTVEQ
jgi:TctA family transporter